MQQGFLGSRFGSWATGTDLAASLLSALLEIVPKRSSSGQEGDVCRRLDEFRVCVCEACRRSLRDVNMGQILLCRAVLPQL